jgi:hypothetical protein
VTARLPEASRFSCGQPQSVIECDGRTTHSKGSFHGHRGPTSNGW